MYDSHKDYGIGFGPISEGYIHIFEARCPRLPKESPACEWAVVQGPNEACWIVEVNKTQNGTYLEEGWEIFVQDNGFKKYAVSC